MKGLGRVVIGSAVGGLVGATSFFAVDGLMPSKVEAQCSFSDETVSVW